MLITKVRAHHIRIPYDAGVASFRQGASAISALDMILVEVSTDAGLTGWLVRQIYRWSPAPLVTGARRLYLLAIRFGVPLPPPPEGSKAAANSKVRTS